MTFKVEVRYKIRAALLWVSLVHRMRWLIGQERALRWSNAGIMRLGRYRLGRGSWRRLVRSDGQPMVRLVRAEDTSA